eukprot:11656516-Alexandrium_andersonii.AAC.1
MAPICTSAAWPKPLPVAARRPLRAAMCWGRCFYKGCGGHIDTASLRKRAACNRQGRACEKSARMRATT